MSSATSPMLRDQDAQKASAACAKILAAVNAVLLGQEELVLLATTALVARGHLLLEGLPGLGKTELVKAIAHASGLEHKRVQFTPDLLPGDITGGAIMQETEGRREFIFHPGPVFTNILLADEINRASPKTQSALLEAMQERSVTVMGRTRQLPMPFFVLATQNPIDLEGTYQLPEAQLDRFLFKVDVRQSGPAILERLVMEREMGTSVETAPALPPDGLQELCALARHIHMPQVVASWIARLVDASHPGRSEASAGVRFGASPRAALALAAATRALALVQGRVHTSFEDVRRLAPHVLRHRIILDYRAKIEGVTTDVVIERLLAQIPASDAALPANVAKQ